MAKKFIDIMDTTFRDGFQSIFEGRVLMDDFLPAVEAAKEAGITHFEFGGGARFQASYLHLQENAFYMMDKFRSIVGSDANLQTLSRGINTVMFDTGSRELIDMHAKLFAKHGTTTIRNFDALNDINNLEYSAQCIKKYGLKHEVVITMMDLPFDSQNIHNVEFYEKTLRSILDSNLPFDSLCFKDASGTSNPTKVYETIKMARRLLGDDKHIRLHTHDTAGVGVSAYLAALEAGVDGIDLAVSPVSGGTSQPDILTLLHATKNTKFDLGGFETSKILEYENILQDCLLDYKIDKELVQVTPSAIYSPLPGGILISNKNKMKQNKELDKYKDVEKCMQEVIEKGGYASSSTPIAQYYWQQAYTNATTGSFNQITEGYGKMILGYFGKTPIAPDQEIIKLASEQLNLESTQENPLDMADQDPRKSLEAWKERLEIENLEINEENIFIAAACEEEGIKFLKGESLLNIDKINDDNIEENKKGSNEMADGNYTVVVDGKKFSVQVARGDVDIQVVPSVSEVPSQTIPQVAPIVEEPVSTVAGTNVGASVNGNVWKVLVNVGDKVEKGQVISILEAMKMEIDIEAPCSGTITSVAVKPNDVVEEGQTIVVIS